MSEWALHRGWRPPYYASVENYTRVKSMAVKDVSCSTWKWNHPLVQGRETGGRQIAKEQRPKEGQRWTAKAMLIPMTKLFESNVGLSEWMFPTHE